VQPSLIELSAAESHEPSDLVFGEHRGDELGLTHRLNVWDVGNRRRACPVSRYTSAGKH